MSSQVKSEKSQKRILFVTLSNIGDVVMSTAVITRILEKYPDAVFDIACGKGSVGLFDDFPNKGDVFPIVKMKYHMHYGALAWQLRHRKYEMVVDLRSSLICAMVRAKKRYMFKRKDGHSVDLFASLIPGEGAPRPQLWRSVTPDMPFKKEEGVRYIALAPTANWRGKQWPQKYWAKLVRLLLADRAYAGTKFIVLGAPHERESVADFIHDIPQEYCIDLVGKTNLKGALAAIDAADIFIGNDSGLGHIAAAFDTPVLSLFGPTKDKVYAPYGAHVDVLTAPERANEELNLSALALPRVMTDIQPEMVKDALRGLQDRLKIK